MRADPLDTTWADVDEGVRRELAGNLVALLHASQFRYVDWLIETRGIKRATAEGAYRQGAHWFVQMILADMKSTRAARPAPAAGA